jgi:hypothetical protein
VKNTLAYYNEELNRALKAFIERLCMGFLSKGRPHILINKTRLEVTAKRVRLLRFGINYDRNFCTLQVPDSDAANFSSLFSIFSFEEIDGDNISNYIQTQLRSVEIVIKNEVYDLVYSYSTSF